MSAICGIYNIEGNIIPPEVSTSMMSKLGIYQADYSNTLNSGQIFFGCHIQYNTPESVCEKLPYYDSMSNMTITADAIIDNRKDLFDKLGLNHKRSKEISDSFLILKAYQKWGKECSAYLLGDFAFAIWDRNKEEIFCSVDHTGSRTFYYYISPELFAFSTLINPLFAIEQISRTYSEEWICDFLSIPSVIHQLDSELTIYQDVLLLSAAQTLTVSKKGISKQVYWQVERQPELILKSDQEYEEALRHVLGQAVSCRLRSIRPVGIMLSGGLDSTSVACLAANELKNKGQFLQAFSSIPIKGYQNSLPVNRIADETPYIEAVREQAGNIDVTYCRFAEKHPLSDIEHFISVFEQPYKVLENLYWINGILAQAQEKNIGIILTGGVGNTTISYGIFRQGIISLMRSGKWLRLLKEISAYSQLKKHPHYRIVLDLVKSLFPYNIQKTWYQMRNGNWDAPLRLSPINPQFAEKIGRRERFTRFKYDPLYQKRVDTWEFRKTMLAPAHLSHLAGIYTKISLPHNLVIRDPTIDKRVIEFCLSVPEEQYIKNGRERYLLRRAMKGILPDLVRLNDRVRGQQSADFAQRLQPLEQDIKKEILGIGRLDCEREYLDIGRIHELVNEINLEDTGAFSSYDLRMLLRSIIFSRFLKYQY